MYPWCTLLVIPLKYALFSILEDSEDVDKLDSVQDGFIHYQLLRFCQATRLQYLNGQVPIENQNRSR